MAARTLDVGDWRADRSSAEGRRRMSQFQHRRVGPGHQQDVDRPSTPRIAQLLDETFQVADP